MVKILTVVLTSFLLTGCGAAINLGLISGSVSVLEPYINNNPNAKPLFKDNRSICYFQVRPNLIRADVCPPGIAAGTRL